MDYQKPQKTLHTDGSYIELRICNILVISDFVHFFSYPQQDLLIESLLQSRLYPAIVVGNPLFTIVWFNHRTKVMTSFKSRVHNFENMAACRLQM